MQRDEKIKKFIEQAQLSVLIVGAGANGAGTFRDLALQGVDVLLIDREDYCSGASAASSHMLHGGIRYLENGEFRLVREALHERNRMLKNAPHAAHPLPTTIPIYRWFSGLFNAPFKFLGIMNKPSERGAIVIKLGLIMYDFFTRSNRMTPTHKFRMKKASLEQFPALNPNILCTASYYDAWMASPERIVLENIMDAEAVSPDATALNYVSLVRSKADEVFLRDEITGQEFSVKPKIVINAAGPWIDFANEKMKQETDMIGGTKGSHLILEHDALHKAVNGHEMFFENEDGRIVLIMPFEGRVMVGTTDIRIDDPELAICTPEEIVYMLGMIPKIFPDMKVDQSHIVYQFCGVRPLPSSGDSYTGNVSRDHHLSIIEADEVNHFPILALIGGKWTSYRAFSEQTADEVLKRMNVARKESTADLPLGGGRDYPLSEAAKHEWIQAACDRSGLNSERVEVLFDRYGTYANAFIDYIVLESDQALKQAPSFSQREIKFICIHEHVEHVDDLLRRRTLLAMTGFHSEELISELAQCLADIKQWDAEKVRDEIERSKEILAGKHGIVY
ncbi:glycerol-3-phosphate dehydrogenase/oxidase [Anaerolineales bacterium]